MSSPIEMPSSKQPKVSVVIPAYNVEAFITEAIESVLKQTFDDFEIVVVIDGSPDNSAEVCRQIEDDRLRIVEQANRGLAGARNTGIRNAVGEYIAFLDGDDKWEPEKLEKHVEHLDSNPQVGVSFSRSKLFGGQSAAYLMSFTGKVDGKRLLCRNPISNGSTPIVRREALDELAIEGEYNQYFDETFRRNEDIELWMRIACLTDWELEGLPEALTWYRVNSEGLSSSFYRQFDSWIKMVDKTESYAPELVKSCKALAVGYQYRSLAQKAVMMGEGKAALDLANRAIASSLGILAEPRGTILTIIASYLLWAMPKTWFGPLLTFGFKVRTLTQAWQIRREAVAR